MFFIVDCIQRRFNTRAISELTGILHVTPNLGIVIFIMCILYSGIPGTMKFVCEFYLFTQFMQVSILLSVLLLLFANIIGVVGFCRC
jgi:formate hydrogenlyase subunit 3/multisubunit Na+/H+ antiporter MnhD subunit